MARALDGRERKTVATKPLTEEQRKLAEGAYWLVEVIAKRFSRMPVSLDERIGWGTEGLIDAAATYDPKAGAKFETWAHYRIRGAIQHMAREGHGSIIRVRDRTQAGSRREDVAKMRRPMSLSWHPTGENFSTNIGSFADLVSDTSRETPVDREMVRKAARTLGRREAIILSMYFGYDWRMKEIGRRLGLSESRVSQTISECLERLRGDRRIREAMTP